MAQSKQLLAVDESENRESVEPVSEQLRAQVQEGDCVVIRGENCLHGIFLSECTHVLTAVSVAKIHVFH